MSYLFFCYSHILADSDNLPVYDDIKKPKEPVPYQTSASGQEYAVPLIAVNNTSEKQQQQIPSVQYAKVGNSQNKSPQQHNQTNGYEEVNKNNIKVNEEVSVYMYTYVQLTYISRFELRYPYIVNR